MFRVYILLVVTLRSSAIMSIENSIQFNIGVGQGGLGLSTVSSGDTIYANASNQFVKLPAGATGHVLLSGTAPSWGKINLDTDIVTGTLSVANGGTNFGTIPINGQLIIGNGSGYTLSTLTAGTNVTITNGAGGITISSTASGSGFTAAEYTTPGTYSYSIPTGAKWLRVILQGAGGASGSAAANANSPGSGGAGMFRKIMIPVAGVITATVVVGAGGIINFSGTSGGPGSASSITINSKLITAEAGGGGGFSSAQAGGGGGSAGSGVGGSTINSINGTAGSATPASGTSYCMNAVGLAGATNGLTAANLTQEAFIIGGSGAMGGSAAGTGGKGGSCAGLFYTSPNGVNGISTGTYTWSGGSSGGSSGMASGGAGGSRSTQSAGSIVAASPGTFGSGAGSPIGCTDIIQNGAVGGNGYVFIQPI